MKRAFVTIVVVATLSGCTSAEPEPASTPELPARFPGFPKSAASAAPLSVPPNVPSRALTPSAASATPLSAPPIVPPETGWHRWQHSPEGCNVYVPDNLSSINVPPWEACPYMPVGCQQMGAPWSKNAGWGYGGPMTVATVGRDTYVQLLRRVRGNWNEAWLLKNDRLVGAWRYRASDRTSLCNLDGPYMTPEGLTSITVIRSQAEGRPTVYLGEPDDVWRAPTHELSLDGPAFPAGIVSRSRDLAVMLEHYQRFTVIDLGDGTLHRPDVPEPGGSLHDPVAIGSDVFFWVWRPGNRSVWVWSREAGVSPILRDDTYSYNDFVSDGKHAAWFRARDRVGVNSYASIEVWAAPIAEGTRELAGTKLFTIPHQALGDLSVGDGWVASNVLANDVRLFRVDGREERRLPPLEGPNAGFHVGPQKLTITGGRVWTRSPLLTNVEHIVRFEIDALPVAAREPP